MADRAANKASRLLQIKDLLLAHPEGLTQAEIARRLKVNRSTIGRCLPDLDQFAVYTTDEGKLAINRDIYETEVSFTLHEALAVHLATRLMATRMDKHNPHAASAMRKLGVALEPLSDLISRHLRASADVMDDVAQRHDPVYLDVLETLTRAWSQGRKVWLKHQMSDQTVFAYTFAPYFIEPYAVGQTTHVIGWREPPGALRTFKVERIKAIRLLDETYTIPDSFDARSKLSDAWGIWYTEAEPVNVVLRFHPRVVHRVQETQWFQGERTTLQQDGSLLWQAQIAEPREMLPWIRGWGADVEVLEPEELRTSLEGEARRLAEVYQVANIEPLPRYLQLWAKTDQTNHTEKIHLLVYHLLDVAQVTAALWDHVLPEATRRYFCEALEMDAIAVRQWLSFLIGLHDLGKACPAFQGQHATSKESLLKAGLSFVEIPVHVRTPHSYVTAIALQTLLPLAGMDKAVARQIAYTLGGHHGVFPTASALQEIGPSRRGGSEWDDVRQELFEAFFERFEINALPPWPRALVSNHAFWGLLSGLVVVSDWIGSIETYFFDLESSNLAAYAACAYEQAVLALHQLGWTGYSPPETPRQFEELFNFTPRPVQEAVLDLAERLSTPALVIVEAPTGEGKTEAALYLADRWVTENQQRGIYVAMPTQATSNQMLGRVRCFLERRYSGQQVDLLLLHGNAAWSQEMESLRLAAVDEEVESTVVAHGWFLQNKKRSLLAPFAVGTVDQALLSVLQTKYFFLRLFGLSHKTVIFDEIHAYDAYMSTLFEHLLRWLAAMDTTVILLSATLPAETRNRLVEAYTGRSFVGDGDYPAITWATTEAEGIIPIDASFVSSRTLNLEWTSREVEEIAVTLRENLSEGGCAAVICNTVSRAQAVFHALQDARIVSNENLILFHARFPFGQRAAVEKRVLELFGPDSTSRPERAIVVATQVIEQSLDLDFDLMLSELAPVDLLLQRAGRLHRHRHEKRPLSLMLPRLLIMMPDMQNGLPAWGYDALVYEPYLLLRSYLSLQGRKTLELPAETPALIAAVYDAYETLLPEQDDAMAQVLEDTYRKMVEHVERDDYKARKNLIAYPHREIWSTGNRQLDEDNPELHETWRALTRLTPPAVTIVCLYRRLDGRMTIDALGQHPIDLTVHPDRHQTTKLIEQTVSVSTPAVVNYFLTQDPPEGWRKHGLLRYYRAAIFTDGRCDAGKYWLILDDAGLHLEKKEV